MADRVVLAYSGGLDTSVAVRWLIEHEGVEVVAVAVDVGQAADKGGEDWDAVRERALAAGAVEAVVIDARHEMAEHFCMPALAANARYEGKYPLVSALSRPVIVRHLVAEARRHGATAVAHGCTGKGNDQVRMDVTVRSLNPSLKVIAPVREWNMSRDQEIIYARKHGIRIKPSNSIFSIDQNLWGRSIESGPLEDLKTEPPNSAFEWVTPPEDAPDKAGYIEIGFVEGIPTSVNGEEKGELELIRHVAEYVGKHGVGIVDQVEDRVVGIKSREVYEAPAALAIIEAHRDLEQLVLTRHELGFKAGVEREWAWLVYSGLWMEPLRTALDSFVATTQARATGSIRLKLYKGGMRVVGRSSPNSLYKVQLSTYQSSSTFDQSSAIGFIELWGLQSRLAAALASEAKRGANAQHTKGKSSKAIEQKSK
jgi:argininosuccinate synthase